MSPCLRGLFKFSLALAIIMMCSIFFIAIVAIYPFNPSVVTKAEVDRSIVKAGQSLILKTTVQRFSNRVGMKYIYLIRVDKTIPCLLLATYLTDLKIGDTGREIPVVIPDYIRPGKYKIRVNIEHNYFNIRPIRFEKETNEFEVI